MTRRKTIGELNGKWAFLLKMTLVLAPVVLTAFLAGSVWVVREIHQGKYERLTHRDGARITQQFHDSLDTLRNEFWEELKMIQRTQDLILLELRVHGSESSENSQ